MISKAIYIVAAKRTPLLPKGNDSAYLSSSYLLSALLRAIISASPLTQMDISSLFLGRGELPPQKPYWPKDFLTQESWPDHWKTRLNCGGPMASVEALSSSCEHLLLQDRPYALLVGAVESLAERLMWTGKMGEMVQQVGRREGLLSKIAFLGQFSLKEISFMGASQEEKALFEQFEAFAQSLSLSREDIDLWTLQSHQKAIWAIQKGLFESELTPLIVGDMARLMTRDSAPRRDLSLSLLADAPALTRSLSPCLTELNLAPETSGGAMLLLANEEMVAQKQLAPMAKIVDFIEEAFSPKDLAKNLIPLLTKLLERSSLSFDQISSFEISEKWPITPLTLRQHFKEDLPADKINEWGGALSLGHPLCAEVPRLLTTLLNRLQHKQGRYGIVLQQEPFGRVFALLVERV